MFMWLLGPNKSRLNLPPCPRLQNPSGMLASNGSKTKMEVGVGSWGLAVRRMAAHETRCCLSVRKACLALPCFGGATLGIEVLLEPPCASRSYSYQLHRQYVSPRQMWRLLCISLSGWCIVIPSIRTGHNQKATTLETYSVPSHFRFCF